MHHRRKSFERHNFEIRVERYLIESLAEFGCAFEPWMATKSLPRMPVATEEMLKVITFKNIVMRNHPMILRRNERLQHAGRESGVRIGRNRVTDIVEQRADDIFLVPARTMRKGCRLQAMGKAVHGKAPGLAFEQFQMRERALR